MTLLNRYIYKNSSGNVYCMKGIEERGVVLDDLAESIQ